MIKLTRDVERRILHAWKGSSHQKITGICAGGRFTDYGTSVATILHAVYDVQGRWHPRCFKTALQACRALAGRVRPTWEVTASPWAEPVCLEFRIHKGDPDRFWIVRVCPKEDDNGDVQMTISEHHQTLHRMKSKVVSFLEYAGL